MTSDPRPSVLAGDLKEEGWYYVLSLMRDKKMRTDLAHADAEGPTEPAGEQRRDGLDIRRNERPNWVDFF